MTTTTYAFNPAPGWLVPSAGWAPPEGWTPEPSWPPAPDGWQFWIATPSQQSAGEQQANGQAPAGQTGPSVPELLGRISELEAQLASREPLGPVRSDADLVDLSDEHVLQDVGIYRYHHPLENATEYKDQLAALNEQIKEMVKGGSAVLASDMFTFNNSLAKGRKMTGEFSKLMLRAYNAEADNCVRALRAGNVVTAKKRLDSSVTAIAKLGSMMEMRINPHYHQLRYRELEMTADHLMKLQEEKEAAREERERLREERKAEQELAAERARLDKERNHYLNSLEALRAAGDEVGVSELSEKLSEIDQAIQQNDFRAANIRAGYVYVISNTGAFGSNMVKIGLTRRLEPMDRVRELGDASVPFPFDVHALFFSEDAVTVEAELHKAFAASRVNHVNQRREFFFATPEEVRQVLVEKVGNLLEFTDEPEATQYLQSKKYWGQ